MPLFSPKANSSQISLGPRSPSRTDAPPIPPPHLENQAQPQQQHHQQQQQQQQQQQPLPPLPQPQQLVSASSRAADRQAQGQPGISDRPFQSRPLSIHGFPQALNVGQPEPPQDPPARTTRSVSVAEQGGFIGEGSSQHDRDKKKPSFRDRLRRGGHSRDQTRDTLPIDENSTTIFGRKRSNRKKDGHPTLALQQQRQQQLQQQHAQSQARVHLPEEQAPRPQKLVPQQQQKQRAQTENTEWQAIDRLPPGSSASDEYIDPYDPRLHDTGGTRASETTEPTQAALLSHQVPNYPQVLSPSPETEQYSEGFQSFARVPPSYPTRTTSHDSPSPVIPPVHRLYGLKQTDSELSLEQPNPHSKSYQQLRPDSRASSFNSRPSSRQQLDRIEESSQPGFRALERGYDPELTTQGLQGSKGFTAEGQMSSNFLPRHLRQADTSNLVTPSASARDPSSLNPSPAPGPETSTNQGISPVPPRTGTPGLMKSQSDQMSQEREGGPLPRSDILEMGHSELASKYQELKDKYNSVKRKYFAKDEQLTAKADLCSAREEQILQLQNSLAHQRLSQSRTSLDDGEYISRLSRLDGAIKQFAIFAKKEWKMIPDWLQPYVSPDALHTGKQEMTAVVRAYVSRWLADEVFDKYFHPSLDEELSMELKKIQKNIRFNASPENTAEEDEALTAKIIAWRLATIEGLGLPSASAATLAPNKQQLCNDLTHKLVEDLRSHMKDPPPPRLQDEISSIIQLAVGILEHLPLESRDVHIQYFIPGYSLIPDLMKIETGIPLLNGAIPSNEDATTGDNDRRSAEFNDDGADAPTSGRLGASQSSQSQQQQSIGASSEELPHTKVRMCLFFSAQIRGKMVLTKSPVYCM